MLQNKPELKSKIDQLWNKCWSSCISKPLTDTEHTAQCFMVPRTGIADEKNNFDLSLSHYKADVFEEAHYDAPGVILGRLIQAEVGNVDDADLARVLSGIVREWLELKELEELKGMAG